MTKEAALVTVIPGGCFVNAGFGYAFPVAHSYMGFVYLPTSVAQQMKKGFGEKTGSFKVYPEGSFIGAVPGNAG